ncbi:hypothetical protein [Streptomyces sp.]|uniref:hypothetical protein n=1 Tax=Streptomyces sp. TaxID=1931 RepID=UPI002810E8D5|nr:hypothetical protein [Streptomyces sp.]
MATRARVEHTRDHVSMSDLLASCAAASALSTPPERPAPAGEADGDERGEHAHGREPLAGGQEHADEHTDHGRRRRVRGTAA